MARGGDSAPVESGRWGSAALALAVLLISLPLLATSPQSGDGAEQLMTALFGGVLHPPGFPLQSWLGRLFVRLPFAAPATGLALLSLLGHAGAVYFIAETLRRLGARFAERAIAALAFAFFPPLWYLAVQPEVYGLTYCFLAALIGQAIALAGIPSAELRARDGVRLGGLFGLALAQHTLLMLALPAVLAGAWRLAEDRTRATRNLGAALAAFTVVLAGAYGSLPLLRTASPWPDWGALDSAAGILKHLLRWEYGPLSLAVGSLAGDPDAALTGLQAFGPALLRSWLVLLPALFAGVYGLLKREGRERQAVLAVLGGTYFLGFLFLARAEMSTGSELAVATLERFYGVLLVPLALVAGVGLRELGSRLPDARVRTAVGAAAALALGAYWAVSGWNQADASADRTLDVFRAALSRQLPEGAVYLSTHDVEDFYGVPVRGGVRFPVDVGLLNRPWYAREVAPRLYPAGAAKAGATVVSPRLHVLLDGERTPYLRGMFYVLPSPANRLYTKETVRGALELCPFLKELGPLPRYGHGFSRTVRADFIRAFMGAAAYLGAQGRAEPASAAKEVARALEEAAHPADWNLACDRLQRMASIMELDRN